ncbi:hypothetical protein SRABI106_03776 [Rahnella aquatilis]|nr:hypothetical protein SRABI106_03776 [Rahnella aquatilis]
MEKANPSWICEILALISALISAAVRVRSLSGFNAKNTVPVFGVLVNCKAFNPGNATASITPSVLNPIALILRITASVRDKDAPSGIFTPAIRYSLSCVGIKPPGTALNIKAAAHNSRM